MKENPIEAAVRPLRSEAIDRAEKQAREIIARIYGKLAEVGWDADTYAPYPDSFRLGRNEYVAAKGLYELVHRLTRWDDVKTPSGCKRFGEPTWVVPDPERAEKFVADSKESAAFQYDAFVAKLVKKVGPCESATLAGNHVWDSSVLTVTKADGEVERWKTQSIWNRSKLGLVFSQWPTRRLKNGAEPTVRVVTELAVHRD